MSVPLARTRRGFCRSGPGPRSCRRPQPDNAAAAGRQGVQSTVELFTSGMRRSHLPARCCAQRHSSLKGIPACRRAPLPAHPRPAVILDSPCLPSTMKRRGNPGLPPPRVVSEKSRGRPDRAGKSEKPAAWETRQPPISGRALPKARRAVAQQGESSC